MTIRIGDHAFGNEWTVATRLERIPVEELHRRLSKQ